MGKFWVGLSLVRVHGWWNCDVDANVHWVKVFVGSIWVMVVRDLVFCLIRALNMRVCIF